MSGKKKAFDWGNLASAQPVSLADVMSEELAEHLTNQELSTIPRSNSSVQSKGVNEHLECFDEAKTEDDFMIAQLLQKQFDKEFDDSLHHEENHYNGHSKVRVTYSKYRMVPEDIIWDDSDDEQDEYLTLDENDRDWDVFETNEKENGGAMSRRGYKKKGEKIVTKHDSDITQRTNAKRVMEFPPGISTGDGGGFDMHLSNQVYNKIRNFSVKEVKRKNRIQDKEERAVTEQAVDPKTRVLLFKLVNGGVLDSINGIISTGKEAVIMHADGGPGPDQGHEIPLNVPKECAVKVFKTTLNEFRTRDKYIRDDYRFKDRFCKQNPRKIIHMWAEKELHNLMKIANVGIRVPEVVVLKKHVLVMSFIGRDGQPAPKLKDAVEHMNKEQIESAYNQVVQIMVALYDKCHLVHADLSEYNILWYLGDCWIIDVSQAVEPIHPSGLIFLLRDSTNVANFFAKWGVPDVLSPTDLFNKITGLNLEHGTESQLLSQINAYQKDQLLKGGLREQEDQGQENFEYCWNEIINGGSVPSTPAKPIPGHHRSKSEKSVYKSPKSATNSTKSPGKSPISDLIAMSDQSLAEFKAGIVNDRLSTSDEVEHLSNHLTEDMSLNKKNYVVSFQ